ncbi:sensor histidine kinase [Chryseolinea lacunae]|uniref:Sensor histidine kinase n=1 Tax=Chryseolinea lacunae TaxID=2801331 RepID=A0ABS1KZC9_9BACT|nr:histidine kinase [Chryseolinea lacunae]MBL0744739.1 sensor histidine kinase [Chryseolinea lacunae]
MTIKPKHLILHIAGCIAFLIVPIVLSPRPPGMPLMSTPTLRDVLANVFMLLIFYLNYYLFIPEVYFKKKQVAYACIIVAGFLFVSLVPSLLTGYVPWNPPAANIASADALQKNYPPMLEGTSFLTQVKHNVFLYVVVILFSILLRVRTKLYVTERLRHSAEMGTLKSQINPHFLFNTLNNIYALAIREKSPSSASAILKLSGMMRYVVTETMGDRVSLEKEISYINDYIELQRMRLTSNVHLSYQVAGVIGGQRIAPLVLIPFIENAFKHGVNPDQAAYLSIRIDIHENALVLVVENQKVKFSHDLHGKSGVGIENTKARLALLYPRKHFLSLSDDPDTYRVQLNIQLD